VKIGICERWKLVGHNQDGEKRTLTVTCFYSNPDRGVVLDFIRRQVANGYELVEGELPTEWE